MKITALSSLSGNPKPYMHYGDNPQRPILSFWFGPMTMVDFLGNYNLWYTGYGNDARAIAGGRAPATNRRCTPASWGSRRP